jgi:hypothetical protein
MIGPCKAKSNSGRQKHFCLPPATVHARNTLQQRRHRAMQTSFGGERRCKIASPLSSKASVAGRRRGQVARAGERGCAGLDCSTPATSSRQRRIRRFAWKPLADAAPRPPRGPEGAAGAAYALAQHHPRRRRPVVRRRCAARRRARRRLTSSWERRSKSIRWRRSSIRRRRSSNRRQSSSNR